jgi:hypothetical protein
MCEYSDACQTVCAHINAHSNISTAQFLPIRARLELIRRYYNFSRSPVRDSNRLKVTATEIIEAVRFTKSRQDLLSRLTRSI